MNPRSAIGSLRLLGLLEGISLLVLLLIAMPLKYAAGMPEAVKYVGWTHGLLFVLFGLRALTVAQERRWPFGRLAMAIAAAFLPFGTFWFDKKLKAEEAGPNDKRG